MRSTTFRIGSSGGLLWTRWWTFWFHKITEFVDQLIEVGQGLTKIRAASMLGLWHWEVRRYSTVQEPAFERVTTHLECSTYYSAAISALFFLYYTKLGLGCIFWSDYEFRISCQSMWYYSLDRTSTNQDITTHKWGHKSMSPGKIRNYDISF
jgi:hypothetical protein